MFRNSFCSFCVLVNAGALLCLSWSLVEPSVSASRTFWFVLDVSLCCSFASAFTVHGFLFSAHAGSVLLLCLVHPQRDIHKTSTCSQHSDEPHADFVDCRWVGKAWVRPSLLIRCTLFSDIDRDIVNTHRPNHHHHHQAFHSG